MTAPIEKPASSSTSAAVSELERELSKLQRRRRVRWVLVIALAGLAVFLAFGYERLAPAEPPASYELAPLERRDIVERVQSTGTVKPLTEVQVGAQVSGRVVKVHADFNSEVKQGDLLAEIDPQLFGAQVSQSSAQLEAARASVKRAEARLQTVEVNRARVRELARENISTQAEIDQAEGEYEVARADLEAAKAQITQLRAQLNSARTTLAYTRIYSPIDGVVINRAVEPGQTVAASFSAPVLFVIAQDLSQMQVMAEIDEADVGKIREKMKAEVVVDAFPGRKFEGHISQVRFSPNTEQGVVTYSAVVDVKNPELLLRPGMTATVTIETAEATGVLATRNAALRFKPLGPRGPAGAPPPAAAAPATPLKHGQGRLYLPSDPGQPLKARVVGTGLTDGIWTELKQTDLQPGTKVVIEEQQAPSKRKLFGIF